MELYLLQHGEATPKEVDPERPLTERGRAEVARVARAANYAGVAVAIICHSGKLRASQTAEIVAREISTTKQPTSLDGLSPNDDPAIAAAALDAPRPPVVLVGHLPDLSRFCSLLLTGDPERQPVQFRMGGIVHLVQDESGVWRVVWILTPEVVPG